MNQLIAKRVFALGLLTMLVTGAAACDYNRDHYSDYYRDRDRYDRYSDRDRDGRYDQGSKLGLAKSRSPRLGP